MNKLLEKYKHISFDLDGTLVHTVPEYRHKIVPIVVSKLCGEIKERYHIDKFWFESGRNQIIRENFKIEPTSFWTLFRELDTVSERSLHTKAYDDAEPAIRKLKEAGKIISILSRVHLLGLQKWKLPN